MCCVMGYTGHDLSAEKFKEYLLRTVDRGPDDQRVVEGPYGLMGFGRLAIMGLTPEGMQPFYRGADCVVCNGELYGFRFEKEILKRRGYKFCSDCDCEILLPLYYEYGLDMFRHMDAEFALILYDSRKDRLIAARDPDECARALAAIGVKEGESVTICMPNAPQAVIMFYAVNKVGAIANMVHPLSSESEIEFCLRESASVVCLTLDQFYGKFANIRGRVQLRSLILTSIKDALSPIKRKGYYLAEGRKIKRVPANAEIVWWDPFLQVLAVQMNGIVYFL